LYKIQFFPLPMNHLSEPAQSSVSTSSTLTCISHLHLNNQSDSFPSQISTKRFT